MCAHEHPPGELLRHAQGNFQDSNPKVGLLLEALTKTDRTLTTVRARQSALRTELTELEFEITSRRQQAAASALRITTLLSHPLLAGIAKNDVEARRRELRAEASAMQEETVKQLALTKPADDLLKHGQAIEQRQLQLENSLRELETTRATLEKRIQDHDARLKASDKLLGE